MTTLVFGASKNPARYSYRAVEMLLAHGYEVVAIGGREAEVQGIDIITGHPELEDIHTITMYMGEKRQVDHEDYLMSLKPKRVIFNPGAENDDFAKRLTAKGIQALEACTLVLLSTGQYEKEEYDHLH